MKLLLTGATGFLGSALARRWISAGHDVHVLVRPKSTHARLATLSGRITTHVSTSSDDAAKILETVDPEAVVHTACVYGRANETPQQILETNVVLGLSLLQALLNGRRCVTFLNAGSVLEPGVSLYALSKRQFSEWGSRLANDAPQLLQFVELRMQHMYGPGDDISKFPTWVMHACHDGVPELRLTTGGQERDFIHIDDVVAAYDAVLGNAGRLSAFDVIEIGSGEAPKLRSFVELIHRLTNAKTQLVFGAVPYRESEAMRCVADTRRLRELGWRPKHGLVSGLQDTLSKEFGS
jgi:CDP-paratose synthetase